MLGSDCMHYLIQFVLASLAERACVVHIIYVVCVHVYVCVFA